MSDMEQMERIDRLEAEIADLRAAPEEISVFARVAAMDSTPHDWQAIKLAALKALKRGAKEDA